jgi:alginate O-acetyltransferase complex protein AlgI
MMPQFAQADTYVPKAERFPAVLAVFAIGLVKKVILADGIASHADPAFRAVEAGHHLSFLEAWGGALGYTFQLYFDFSGYCDMAIGLSWMFGIGLPLNFNSPYKARSIVDFWHLWHMTLSRFLRDYLYIPLGGSRRGSMRRYENLLATMIIGGMWHGAGWTFIVWGALHGFYLTINHAWSALRTRFFGPPGRLEQSAAWILTFVAVVVGWVFFRSTTLEGSLGMLMSMAGANGFAPPPSVEPASNLPALWAWCLMLGVIAFGMPNTQDIMGAHLPPICRPPEPTHAATGNSALLFKPSLSWAAAVAALLAASLVCLPQPTSFLYFNF